MLTIILNLPKRVEQELEKDLQKLETITDKPRDFHIKEAIIRYLEHAEKLVKYYEKEREKGSKDHTTEELLEHLNLKKVDV
jgi:predicted transcriptional regulator